MWNVTIGLIFPYIYKINKLNPFKKRFIWDTISLLKYYFQIRKFYLENHSREWKYLFIYFKNLLFFLTPSLEIRIWDFCSEEGLFNYNNCIQLHIVRKWVVMKIKGNSFNRIRFLPRRRYTHITKSYGGTMGFSKRVATVTIVYRNGSPLDWG